LEAEHLIEGDALMSARGVAPPTPRVELSIISNVKRKTVLKC